MNSSSTTPALSSSSSKNAFDIGNHLIKLIKIEPKISNNSGSVCFPPKPLLIGTPTESGIFPVLILLHGYLLYDSFYSQLIQHISSHGFIVVATQSKMVESLATISEGRYTYINDTNKGPRDAIDIHHIIISRSSVLSYIFYVCILLSATFCFLHLPQDMSMAILFSFTLAVCLVKSWRGKQVEKESVMILPAFGVQLETIYRSGRTVRRFVPICKILKPVLNECVTPVTCYWSLSLIIREEEELLLVFKELHPPMTMLVPIWKALCAAIVCGEFTDVH